MLLSNQIKIHSNTHIHHIHAHAYSLLRYASKFQHKILYILSTRSVDVSWPFFIVSTSQSTTCSEKVRNTVVYYDTRTLEHYA